MDLKFENSFKRDLKKIEEKDVLEELKKVIKNLEELKELKDFKGDPKKLRRFCSFCQAPKLVSRNFWSLKISSFFTRAKAILSIFPANATNATFFAFPLLTSLS